MRLALTPKLSEKDTNIEPGLKVYTLVVDGLNDSCSWVADLDGVRRSDRSWRTVKIELLHLEGCQNSELAWELIDSVVSEMRLDVPVSKVEIRNMEDAQRLSFYGSPTIQINGQDIDPSVRGQSTFAFG